MKLGLECIISVTSTTTIIILHAGAQVSMADYKSVKSTKGSCKISKSCGTWRPRCFIEDTQHCDEGSWR